jgi:hypothetical protein
MRLKELNIEEISTEMIQTIHLDCLPGSLPVILELDAPI